MAFQSYSWAAGNGVALASLVNFEDDVTPNNRKTASHPTRLAVVRSQPVDAFPVRIANADGTEVGDGSINHEWLSSLTTLGIKYILDTYLSSGTVAFAAMTINTRRHELDTFTRYNANLILPSPANRDIEYVRDGVFRVRLRFRDLVAL